MILIPVNGKNERMGSLFRTPKHLLLHKGEPIIGKSVRYLKKNDKIKILAGYESINQLEVMFPEIVTLAQPTDNVIETLLQYRDKFGEEPVMIVDCDIIPNDLYGISTIENLVYVFDNNDRLPGYSNYSDKGGIITSCNEKETPLRWAGAGVYQFRSASEFFVYADEHKCKSVSEVVAVMIKLGFEFKVVPNQHITRLGSLYDITGPLTFNTGNKIVRDPSMIGDHILKMGMTALTERDWYMSYLKKSEIPDIFGYGESPPGNQWLEMEDLVPEGKLDVSKVLYMISNYSKFPRLNDLKFQVYVDRIKVHLMGSDIVGGPKLLEMLKAIDLVPTFAHGDLSTRNIIQTASGPQLIDPLYSKDTFGHYLLDIAKLIFSLKFYENDALQADKVQKLVKFDLMDTLVASEAVRVATYNKRFNFIAENLINEL